MSIAVRPATAEDLPVLRDRQARPDLQLVDDHFTAQEAGTVLFAVAHEGDEILGTALLDLDSDADLTPELRNMWVYPEARRRGAGRALSQWIEDQARSRGFTEVFLAVDPNNEKAIPLYVSLEYHPTGEHVEIDVPEVPQVTDGDEPANHYAVYKKSLTAHS